MEGASDVPPVANPQQAAAQDPEPRGQPQALVPQAGDVMDLDKSEEENLASRRGTTTPPNANAPARQAASRAGVGSRASAVSGSGSADAAGGFSSSAPAPVLKSLNQGDEIPYTLQVKGSYYKFVTDTEEHYLGKSKRTATFLRTVRRSFDEPLTSEVIVGVVSRVRGPTIKNNSDAVVSDESAVLGLGNIAFPIFLTRGFRFMPDAKN